MENIKNITYDINQSAVLVIASENKSSENTDVKHVILLPIRIINGVYYLNCIVSRDMIYNFQCIIDFNDSTVGINIPSSLNIIGSFPSYDIYNKTDHIAHIFLYLNGGEDDSEKYLNINIDYNSELINIINIIDTDTPETLSEYKDKMERILFKNITSSDFTLAHIISNGKYIQYNPETDTTEVV